MTFEAIREYGRITINGYSINIPNLLTCQFDEYKKVCEKRQYNTDNGKLFVDDKGMDWGTTTTSSNADQYLWSAINERSFAKVFKIGIMNLLLAGIDSKIISDITEAGDNILSECVRNCRNHEEWNEFINIIMGNSNLDKK